MIQDPKPWYASRGIWGGIVAGLAAAAGLFGIVIDEGAQASIADIAVSLAGSIGALLAIWGRLAATREIA